MKKQQSGQLIYSPSDLVHYVTSPFASWMYRYHLENPRAVTPDGETEDQKLIAQTGDQHEHAMLEEFKLSVAKLVEIPKDDPADGRSQTLLAIKEIDVTWLFRAR